MLESWVCLRHLPQVPVPGGKLPGARSCGTAHCVFWKTGLCSHLGAQEGSWWLGLSWMLAGFLHGRRGITTPEHHRCSGPSARQTGYTRLLPGSCEGVPCSDSRASSAVGWRKGLACTGAGAGRFFVPPGNLAASKEPWGYCQSAAR